MKRKTKNILLSLVVHIIIILTIVFYVVSSEQKKEDRILDEYPCLLKSDSINDIIKSTYFPETWRGGEVVQMITFENGKKYTISAFTKLKYNTEVMKGVNVRLIKKANNDSIWVFTGEKKYLFMHHPSMCN